MCPKNLRELNIRKILVIGANSIGYNLLITPAVKRIRDAFKDAEMEIVIGDSAIEFAEGNPWFSGYISYSKHFLKFLRSARRKRYDLVVSFANPLIPFFLRGKYRLSFFYGYFFSEKTFTHESERLLKFIEPFLGKGEKPGIHFPISDKDRDYIDSCFRKDGIKDSDTVVVLVPALNAAGRGWAEENFARTAKEILKNYDVKIIIAVGDDKEKQYATKIQEFINNRNVCNYAGKTSMRKLTALFEKTNLLITDSVVHMHLAGAVKCPVVAIFGPSNPYRQGPIGTKNIIVHSNLECFPCKVRKRCRKNFACMERISSDKVARASMLFLDEKKQPLLFDL